MGPQAGEHGAWREGDPARLRGRAGAHRRVDPERFGAQQQGLTPLGPQTPRKLTRLEFQHCDWAQPAVRGRVFPTPLRVRCGRDAARPRASRLNSVRVQFPVLFAVSVP